MMRDRHSGLLLKRFAMAFTLAAGAIGAGVLIAKLTTTEEVDRATTILPSSTTVTESSAGPVSTAKAQPEAPESTGEIQDQAPESITDSVLVAAARRELPQPDAARYCMEMHGPGSTAVVAGGLKGVECLSPDGSPIQPKATLDEVCKSQVEATSRWVHVQVGDVSNRCSTTEGVVIEPLDFVAYCPRRYGLASEATLIADDSNGWRCAVVKGGVFEIYVIDTDLACQTLVDRQTFASATEGDDSPTAWNCYGLP